MLKRKWILSAVVGVAQFACCTAFSRAADPNGGEGSFVKPILGATYDPGITLPTPMPSNQSADEQRFRQKIDELFHRLEGPQPSGQPATPAPATEAPPAPPVEIMPQAAPSALQLAPPAPLPAPSAPSAPAATGTYHFVSKEGQFHVDLPKRPRQWTFQSDPNQPVVHQAQADMPDISYSANYYDLPPDWQASMRNNTAAAADAFFSEASKMLQETQHPAMKNTRRMMVAGRLAYQMEFICPGDVRCICRIALTDKRCYKLVVGGVAMSFDNPGAQRFLDSFGFEGDAPAAAQSGGTAAGGTAARGTVAGGVVAGGPFHFVSRAGNFHADFPGQPRESNARPDPKDTVVYHTDYSGDQIGFGISYWDFAPAWLTAMRANPATAADNYANEYCRMVQEHHHPSSCRIKKLNGRGGRTYQVECDFSDGTRFVRRIVLTDTRCYELAVQGAGLKFDGPAAERFLDSFGLDAAR